MIPAIPEWINELSRIIVVIVIVLATISSFLEQPPPTGARRWLGYWIFLWAFGWVCLEVYRVTQ